MTDNRQNTDVSKVVQEGLALARAETRYHATHYMVLHRVPFRVIVRVLGPGARLRVNGAPGPGH